MKMFNVFVYVEYGKYEYASIPAINNDNDENECHVCAIHFGAYITYDTAWRALW